jgi:hypothetical protein
MKLKELRALVVKDLVNKKKALEELALYVENERDILFVYENNL